MELNKNSVNASIIRVDLVRPSASYLIDNTIRDNGRSFFIKEENEYEMTEFIKLAGKEMGLPIARVYSTSHIVVYEDDIHTKEDIVRFFNNYLYNRQYESELTGIGSK